MEMLNKMNEFYKEMIKKGSKEINILLYELIKNSEESEYEEKGKVRIIKKGEGILYENNDKGISKEEFEALIEIKKTTKNRNINKGVGFKYFYNICDEIYIKSKENRIKVIIKDVKLIDIKGIKMEKEEGEKYFEKNETTQFYFKIKKEFEIQLSELYENINENMILFLKKIGKKLKKIKKKKGKKLKKN
jgi:anti-sigma regulatory factor (Ser/Thr protein kinase)